MSRFGTENDITFEDKAIEVHMARQLKYSKEKLAERSKIIRIETHLELKQLR